MNDKYLNTRKSTLLGSLLAIALILPVWASASGPETKWKFDINTASLEEALILYAQQSGLVVAAPQDLVKGKDAPAIQGELSAKDALTKLLADSGLQYQFTSDESVLVSKVQVEKVESEKKGAAKQNVIEEIIVTAEKREQNVQDVPVAISAFSAEMMEMRGIATPQDLQANVPGLTITEFNGGTVKATMRGIGMENTFAGGDPGVPIHINGHYTQSPAYMLRDMLDVERVEVQRGPQGTLYGRNAIGGNINIITKRPTAELEGMLGIDIGNYDKRMIQGVISGPLNESIRGRLAISGENRDGYVENLGTADDRGSSDYTNIRGSVEFDITNNLQVFLSAFSFDDNGTNAQRLFSEYPSVDPYQGGPNYWLLNSAGSNITVSDPFKIRENTANEQTNKSEGVAVDFAWDLGSIELRSLTAYDDTRRVGIEDFDSSDVVSYELDYDVGFETITQEFQLLSNNNSRLSWITGLFYYNEKSHYNFDAYTEARSDNNGDGVTNSDDTRRWVTLYQDVEAESGAFYGQAEYKLFDALELIAGLRYTRDKKKMIGDGIRIGLEASDLPPVVVPGFINDETWSEVTGKVGLNYHISDDLMTYLSYSTGYKSGGFNPGQEIPYDPETLDAYEIGLKGQWRNRVQINIAGFYYDYQDKQDFQRIVTPELSFFEIRNASVATMYGIELEGQAYITDAFQVDISVGYQHTEFDEFISRDGIQPGLGNQDLSGNELPFAPEWKVHLGAQYEWVLSGFGRLTVRGDYSWTDDQYSNAFNRKNDGGPVLVSIADLVPSYDIVDARLQWESSEAGWRAELYIKNITDEVAYTGTFLGAPVPDVGTVRGWTLMPRTYGLKIQHNF